MLLLFKLIFIFSVLLTLLLVDVHAQLAVAATGSHPRGQAALPEVHAPARRTPPGNKFNRLAARQRRLSTHEFFSRTTCPHCSHRGPARGKHP